MATARAVLERGDPVVIFPEGTRIRDGLLGRPKRGVGTAGAGDRRPVVPIAVTGTENARRGWLIRPVKVPDPVRQPADLPAGRRTLARLANEVTARIWPCVELQWGWLGGPLDEARRRRDPRDSSSAMAGAGRPDERG